MVLVAQEVFVWCITWPNQLSYFRKFHVLENREKPSGKSVVIVHRGYEHTKIAVSGEGRAKSVPASNVWLSGRPRSF